MHAMCFAVLTVTTLDTIGLEHLNEFLESEYNTVRAPRGHSFFTSDGQLEDRRKVFELVEIRPGLDRTCFMVSIQTHRMLDLRCVDSTLDPEVHLKFFQVPQRAIRMLNEILHPSTDVPEEQLVYA